MFHIAMAKQPQAKHLRQLTSVDSFFILCEISLKIVGGAVVSWLARTTLERALRVRSLARDIVLCSWARHFTLTVPLSTQVYKWVPANLMLGGNPAMD